VFIEPTTSAYAFTTSIPEPKLSYEQRAEYAEASAGIPRELLEYFNVESLFGHTLKLKEPGTVPNEQDREVNYTLYIAESGTHHCPRLNVTIGGEEVAALLDTGCEMSIINEQLYIGESKSIRTSGLILCGLAVLLSACTC
jgi:hypothetical protein